MTNPSQDDDDTVPGSKSPGNEGARGSRGQANSGAQAENSTQEGGNKRARSGGTPDLRDQDAQGGGGAASPSSRSK